MFKIKFYKIIIIYILIINFIYIASCSKEVSTRPNITIQEIKQEEKQKEEKLEFYTTDITTNMKIFGTGENFYGVVKKNEYWRSIGNPPHYLIFDTDGIKGCYFEGIEFDGLYNISEISIYTKNSEIYNNKYKITNIGLTNSKAKIKFNNEGYTNLLEAMRIKIEFNGTNIIVSNIIIHGILGKEEEYKLVKEYKMDEVVIDKIKKSSEMLKKKKYEKAIELNEEAIRIDPENPYPYMNLGQIWQEKSEKVENHNEYIIMMDKSLDYYESAERWDNPERVILIERLIKIYWGNLIDPEKALRYEEKLLKIKQENKFSQKDIAKSYLNLAEEYSIKVFELESIEEREKIWNLIVEYYEKGYEYIKNYPLKPNNNSFAEPLCSLHAIYMGQKQYEKAIELGKMLIEKLPETEVVKEGGVHMELALAYMALGRWEEAIEAWKEYINCKPIITASINSKYCISFCYFKLNNIDLSYKFYVNSYREEFLKSGNKIENENEFYDKLEILTKKYNIDEKEKDFFDEVTMWAMYDEIIELYIKYNIVKPKNSDWLNYTINKVKEYIKLYNIEF